MNYETYEREFIVSLMVGGLTPSAIEVLDKITPNMLTPKYASIYRSITELNAKGLEFTVLEVADKCDWDLSDLVAMVKDSVGHASRLKVFAKRVRQGYLLREASERLGSVLSEIESCEDESRIGDISEALETVIQSLVIETDDKKPRLAADILEKYIEIIDDRYSGGEESRRLKFGIDAIDEVTQGVNQTDLIIAAGAPGMGKTEFMIKLINGCSDEKGGALVFSMEMDEYQLIERSLACEAGIPISHARSPRGMNDEDWARFSMGMGIVKSKQFHVLDQAGLSVNEICAAAARHKSEFPAMNLICIDYVGLIRLQKADRHDIALGEVSRRLKQLAKELKTPVMLLSQIKSKDVETRQNKRPLPSDIKDSSRLQDDADWIVFPYRDEVYNSDSTMKGIAEIIFGKARHGTAKTVYMGWKHGHFTEISQEYAAGMVASNEADNRQQSRKDF